MLRNTKMSRRTSSRKQKEIGSEFIKVILNEPACLLIYDLSPSLAIRSTPLLHESDFFLDFLFSPFLRA